MQVFGTHADSRYNLVKLLTKILLLILTLFILPALLSVSLWAFADRPQSWRQADWNPTGILAQIDRRDEAVVHIMAARTGGLKGALSLHTWIVTKEAGVSRYNRYDKVGWGSGVRKNMFEPDARWYSNRPFFVKTIRGGPAKMLIPKIEKAISNYPYNGYGEYRLWPGPNSNSFVAYVLRSVPELNTVLPANAVGRDFTGKAHFLDFASDGRDIHFSIYGLIGGALGARSGIELHLLGLVFGLDITNPGIKLPGFGRVGI